MDRADSTINTVRASGENVAEQNSPDEEAILANFRRPSASRPGRPVIPEGIPGAIVPEAISLNLPDIVIDTDAPMVTLDIDEPVIEFDGPVSAPSAGAAAVDFDAENFENIELAEYLHYLVERGGSDLHLSAGAPALIRLHGDMVPIPGSPRLTAATLKSAIYSILTPIQIQAYERDCELDLAYTIPGLARFRVNIMRQRQMPGAVFRVVPSEIRPLEELGLPPVLYSFAGLPRGLVLVTGPTGSGKSTTLASLIDRANRTRSGHIITVEDPIEFLHTHRSCVVNQREVGTDTQSFAEALKHILRQDPDIILIGELRDLETISIALTAAETGHLVFATLHTQSAQDTVSRIIDVFPAAQQAQIRSQLAATLKGVVCQSLVKRADKQGRIPAVEVMVVTNAIAQMIRRDETHQIHQALQSGGAFGMQTLNQHLAELVVAGSIERDTAEEYATDLKDLDALIQGKASARKNMGSANRSSLSAPSTGLTGSSI
jgi:twitching motility protein PilT